QHPTCAGYANGSATVMVTGGTPSYTYAWSANTGGQVTPTASGLPSGAYLVTVTDANHCTAQASTPLLAPSSITLNAQAPDTVCVNVPVQLTAQATGGHGGFAINWAGIGTGDTLLYSFPASQTVTVTVSDALGCTGPTLHLPVTVLDLSTATLHTYGDTTLCPGSTAVVGAWVGGYPSTTTITWPELPATGTGPFSLPMTQDRTLTVIATDACNNTLHALVPIDVQTPPTITLPPIIAEGCAPLTAHFPSGLSNQPVTYLWTLGDGTTSPAPAPVHVYNAGTYTVSLTVTTPIGCVGHATNTGQVIAHAPPVAAFTADPWHTNMDAPQVQFTDQSTGAVSTWTWNFGDQGSSGSPDPSHTYTAPGTYAVQLTVQDAFGCSDAVTHNVQIDPVYEITVPNVFTPDPNGGGGGTYDPLDLSNDVFYPFIRFVKDFRMRIFNRWGELVFESTDLKRGWDGYYRGQISPQDVYVYQVWVRFVDNKEREKMGDLTLFR
ncbi:MAG: PKD domain-containing protein, partial [Bacteroidetes bacterium]|nr:PKD domain-containing protein [Bacteroidota bacterium]